MVEYFKWKEKEYPFLYNYYAISRLQRASKEVPEEELFEHILYYGFESGCYELDIPFKLHRNGKEIDVTPKDCAFIIGDIGIDKVNEMMMKFVDNSKEDNSKKN